MKRLSKKDLKGLFVSEVQKNGGICGNDNPFRLVMGENEYFIFIKNISPAYYVNSPNITRVQLPVSKRFNEVITSNLVFLILGYDMENDVFVSWDPHKVKQRLNKKSNISLFSRLNLQSEVISNEIKVGYLSNGDKIIETANSIFNKVTMIGHKDWRLPDEMTKHMDTLVDLRSRGLINFKEKYGWVLWSTDIYMAEAPK